MAKKTLTQVMLEKEALFPGLPSGRRACTSGWKTSLFGLEGIALLGAMLKLLSVLKGESTAGYTVEPK